MEAEYDIEVEGPVVYVYEADDTYDSMFNQLLVLDKMMKKNQKKEDRKESPLERTLNDIFAAMFIYFGTFILCDLIRTFREGEWTPLYWSIWGPWKYISGAPLIKKIIKRYRDNHDRISCQDGFNAIQDSCDFYNTAYTENDKDVIEQGKDLKDWLVDDLIQMGLPIVYDYNSHSGVEACYEIGQIYLIRCQNRGIQGDAREASCQRMADNWMRETIANATHNYTVYELLNGWLDQYNTCLENSVDPPDRSPNKQQQCLDANNDWLTTCNNTYYDSNECNYIYDNNTKACSGDVDSIYGCSEYYKAYGDCVANAKDPEVECGNIKADLKWCENFEYQYADPNVRLT